MNQIELTILFDIAIVVASAAILANVAKFLRQPLLIGYVLAGIIIGPQVLGLVNNQEIILLFAELGIGFLLFVVGLELDLSKFRKIKKVVFFSSMTTILVLFCIAFSLLAVIGFPILSATYGGLFIAFSSTAVLVKLLSNTHQIDTLHGRIILGTLVIEDIVAVLAISMLSSLSFQITPVLISLALGAFLFGFAIFLGSFFSPWFFPKIEDSPELILITALTFFFGFIGVSIHLGFTAAVGGFLAGLSMTAFPVNLEIVSGARSLRDFFSTIFFVSLGVLFDLQGFSHMIGVFLVLLALVVFLKPLLVSATISLFGYGKKTSFLSGISLAQVSEFSLIIAMQGLALNHIGKDMFSLAVGLVISSVVITTYVFRRQQTLYHYLSDKILTFPGTKYEEKEKKPLEGHVIVMGAHLGGRRILNSLDRKEQTLIIDYNPEIIDEMKNDGFRTLYGDVRDPETLENANVEKAKAIISTVPGDDKNRFIVNYIKRHNSEALIIVSSRTPEGALEMYREGADYVLYPHTLAGKEAADVVRKLYDAKEELEEAKKEEIDDLRKLPPVIE